MLVIWVGWWFWVGYYVDDLGGLVVLGWLLCWWFWVGYYVMVDTL